MNESDRANSVLITINLGDPYIIEGRGVVYDAYIIIKNDIPVVIITFFLIKNTFKCNNSLFTIIFSIKRISRIIFFLLYVLYDAYIIRKWSVSTFIIYFYQTNPVIKRNIYKIISRIFFSIIQYYDASFIIYRYHLFIVRFQYIGYNCNSIINRFSIRIHIIRISRTYTTP